MNDPHVTYRMPDGTMVHTQNPTGHGDTPPPDMTGRVVGTVQVQGWATPRPGLTLDGLIEVMAELGNEVIEVDRDNNRLLVVHVDDTLYADSED